MDYSLTGLETVDAKTNGDHIEIGLNIAFAIEALRTVADDVVTIKYIAPNRPVIIEDKEKLILIMPLSLNQ